MNGVHYLKSLIYNNYCCVVSIISLTHFQTCEVTTIMYHETFEWYISCMVILQDVMYSGLVTVILEYVDLLDILAVKCL